MKQKENCFVQKNKWRGESIIIYPFKDKENKAIQRGLCHYQLVVS